jgi:hypothetical protein
MMPEHARDPRRTFDRNETLQQRKSQLHLFVGDV